LRLCRFCLFLLLVEADLVSVLPMTQADKFKTLGITPPKGALMYGPPGKYHSLRMSAIANFD
jgi:ATP-dependent 26S proteasome regulatory subunit